MGSGVTHSVFDIVEFRGLPILNSWAELGVLPSTILFLDDNQMNVEAAQKVGVNATQVIGFEQLHLAPTLATRSAIVKTHHSLNVDILCFLFLVSRN